MAARYTLIKGTYAIVGTEPDGDTVRFQPDVPATVDGLGPSGQAPAWTKNHTQVNVRFEAIDALETHFQNVHQDPTLGDAATTKMLSLLGFSDVQRSSGSAPVTSAQPTTVRGYLVANSLDSYGRVIAFVYAGEPQEADGTNIFLDVPRLAQSVNAQLLEAGLVYPAFYTTLPTDLAQHLAAQTRVVREQQLGVWPTDAPSVDRGASVPSLTAAETLVMWPKLFRRLAAYFQDGNQGLANFAAWLRADQKNRDDFLQLPTGEFGNMHDMLAIQDDTMKLNYRPEDVIILPDTFVPQPASTADLHIVAALVNPVGADAGHETVTLLNAAAASVDLTGWQIRDRQLVASGAAGFPLKGSIQAGECQRITVGAPVALSNSGDDIVLVDPQGRAVQSLTYTADQAKSGFSIAF